MEEIKSTLLTPELAQQLMANRHPRQRRPAVQTVAIYANEMRLGRWRPNVPDPILVDTEGRLFNGGHRCAAVVESGVSIEVLIAYDADSSMFDVIDTGRRRSAYQFIVQPDAGVRASAARIMLWYRRRFDVALNARGIAYFDMAEILAEADRSVDQLSQALPLARTVYEFTNIPVPIASAVFVLAAESGIEWDLLLDFRDGIVGMANLPEDDPRRVLAERMRQKRHRDRRRQPMEDWTILVRSLNRYVRHEWVPGLTITQVWPSIGEPEKAFNRRRQATKNAQYRDRDDQDGLVNQPRKRAV